jgi:hypothetical protein
MVTQRAQIASSPTMPSLHRDDDKLYAVSVRGMPLYLYWSEMTLAQRRAQIALEGDTAQLRAMHIAEFGIYT